MKPAAFKHRNTLQLSYELQHQIHASAVYPVRSPNGSRIILYGHEEGIRIIWYGGRSYRQPVVGGAAAYVNGKSKDQPMVIDLSDDDKPAAPLTQAAEFEEEDKEVDPAEPYEGILRYIDIELGTSATCLAVPQISPAETDSMSDSHASILSGHLVVAVGCTDLTIRLISLPLAPPAESAKEPSAWKIQSVQLPASSGHQDFITSISVTDFAGGHDQEAGGDRSKSRSRSGARITPKGLESGTGPEWSFLIASTSCTGSGLLLIHKIPLTDQTTFNQSPEVLFPAQRQLLRSPLSACRLRFNPSPHPADRATNLLITLPDAGCVKVYQVVPQATHARGRRGSAATMDSATSSAGSTRAPTRQQQGKFLVTLYSAFLPPDADQPIARRKRPVDASWVLGGRAILTLFENGDWGVWDLEAAGPPSAAQTQNLVKGQGSVSGVQGGAQAQFTIKGSVLASTIPSMKSRADASGKTGLAPMTPHTRQTQSDRLFESKAIESKVAAGGVVRGSIEVAELPRTAVTQSSKFADESILLTYGDSVFHLPSLLTFWRAEVSGHGTFGISSDSKLNSLAPLRLGGQHINSVSQLPIQDPPSSTGTSHTLVTEFLTTTDHTLVLLLSPLSETNASHHSQPAKSQSLAVRLPGTSTTTTNELLLQRGELGIDGLDNMLNDMRHGNARSTFGKSVGFDVDNDVDHDDDDSDDVNMDIDMRASIGTPTPKVSARHRPTPRGSGTPRAGFRPGQSKVRLFS